MSLSARISGDHLKIALTAGDQLARRLSSVSEGEAIRLEVGGVIGRWRRTGGETATSIATLVPLDDMAILWQRWQSERRDDWVAIADWQDSPTGALFPEWRSAEDEEAFRDL